MTPTTPQPSAPSDAAPSAAAPARKRSGGTAPTDADVAAYSAARGFLLGEWFGATLLVASFTLLYLLAFGAHATPAVTYSVCGGLLLLGGLAYLRSRAYYERIGVDAGPRMHVGALVVAGSAAIFWLLFLVLVTLAWLGIPIQ